MVCSCLGWFARSGKVSGVYSVWKVSMDRRYIVSETSKHINERMRSKQQQENYPSRKKNKKKEKGALIVVSFNPNCLTKRLVPLVF